MASEPGDAGATTELNPTVIELADELEELTEIPRSSAPMPAQPSRSIKRSIPPPIPSGDRRKRTSLSGRNVLAFGTEPRPQIAVEPARGPTPPMYPPASPTVLDRALAARLDPSGRAAQLAKELEVAVGADPAAAAILAYELGELHERGLADEARAVTLYRRALELDPSLRPNLWALRRVHYRRAAWPDLVKLVDVELGHAVDDSERVELLLERALVFGNHGGDAQARSALDEAVRIAPRHQGALLELERVLARTGDGPALLEVWERLAESIEQPDRKIACWLEVARAAAERDVGRALAAFDQAANLAAALPVTLRASVAERVARERLRIADARGTPAQVGAAIEALAQALTAAMEPRSPGEASGPRLFEHPDRALARRRELGALRRRQAQRAAGKPLEAWDHLQQALALGPSEPVVLVELVELAAELGRSEDLVALVQACHAAQGDTGRTTILSFWSAEAHLRADRREQIRALLKLLESTAPGFILLTSTAECAALADPSRVWVPLDLANTYCAAAHAAMLGTWLGPGVAPRPDPAAAAALYVQAADLLAYHVGTAATLDQARDALGKALEAAPDDPAVREAMTELDDTAGRAEDALGRLRASPSTGPERQALLERAIRLARTHGLLETVLELESELVSLVPDDTTLAWRLEATLFEIGEDGERAELLDKLARTDPDPARRRTALFGAARLHERAGSPDVATDRYRQLLALWPQDGFARDALIGLLRSQEHWAELVTERRAEARALSDGALVRRALREAAWVLEVRLEDAVQAAEVYEEWLAWIPSDRTALEGVARCRAQLGDHAREVSVRAKIAELDQTTDADWLFARSLERAGWYDQAAELYRRLMSREDSQVAAISATLAIGDLAARGANVAMRVEAADALARRTTDPLLGAALFEDSGWMYVVALEDLEHAAEAFAAACALQPNRRGALLGTALVAARQSEPLRQADAYLQLGSTMEMPDAAVGLLLRASAIAAANGEPALANERLEAARAAAPDNIHALFVAAEAGTMQPIDTSDPFAAADHLLARAQLLEQRGAMSDDPVTRASWELDRAEVLEQADQLREAGAVIAGVLRACPTDRRAVAAMRRLAHRVDDKATWAQASYALARLCHDPAVSQRLLREALEVYGRAGSAPDAGYELAIQRRMFSLDPGAPAFERMLELLRERDDPRTLIGVLTARLAWLAAMRHEDRMIPLLLERAQLLRGLGRPDRAIADLDSLLEHAPANADVLWLRADLAIEAGDSDTAVALWWRYLAVETGDPRRADVEQQLARALANEDDVAPPPTLVAEPLTSVFQEDEPKTDIREPKTDVRVVDREVDEGWDIEPTDVAMPRASTAVITQVVPSLARPAATAPAPAAQPGQRRSPAIIRRTHTTGSVATQTVADEPDHMDPFGAQTVRTDLSELQEQERREAQGSGVPADDYDVEITGDVPKIGSKALATGPVTTVRERPSAPTTPPANPGGPRRATPPRPPPPVNRKLTPPAIDATELLALPLDPADDLALEPSLAAPVLQVREPELTPDDSDVVMMSYEQLQSTRPDDDATVETLAWYEQELAMLRDPSRAVGLRIEAGRLAERLGENERAHAHYEAAVLADPRASGALVGLRRIARSNGDLVEVTRLVDAELVIAGPREREALLRHRIDLLMATGEQDIARVAVGELLDSAPLDLPALLAQLELAFLDDRADEFGRALELLADAITDPDLRGTLQSARAILATRQEDHAAAAVWLAAAAESDPDSPATRLGAIRHAAAQGQGEAAGIALLELAYHVEGDDPITAAALAVRAQLWAAGSVTAESTAGETIAGAAQLAARSAPRDPLVARIATEAALVAGDSALAIHAFTRWARCKCSPVERAYAAACAGELEPGRLGRLWAQVLELDPGDDYASARLRAVHVAAGEAELAIKLDLQVAAESHRDSLLIRAASALIGQDQVQAAIEALVRGREHRPTSVALAEALAEALAKAGRWRDRATLLRELSAEPGMLAGDFVRLRSALAWDKAATIGAESGLAHDELEAAIMAALEAWDLVLADDPRAPVGHAATIVLASRLEDGGILTDVLARARAAERSPWAASSLALRLARLQLGTDPRLAHEVVREAASGLDDPRRTLALMLAAAHRHELGDAATALEDRAAQLDADRGGAEPSSEPATLRLRAAQLALDADDVPRATVLLARVDETLPGLVDDLIDAARRRADGPATTPAKADSFLRVLREADLAAGRGEAAAALALYQRALELRPADPFAAAPLVRIASGLRDPGPITALALDQLRSAEAIGDATGKAEAYELLARVDKELRNDLPAAQISLQSASQADPGRIDLMHRLERQLAVAGQHAKLLQLRERELELITRSGEAAPQDLAALIMDTATLAVRARRPDPELAKLYRAALEVDPDNRRTLFHLESILRRSGASDELAALEVQIAEHFEDPRARAAFLTRAGDTFDALHKPAEAVGRFARAVEALPTYLPALEAWQRTALEGALWTEVAEAATHKAVLGAEPVAAAALHHFAGVALMDKAQAIEPAIAMFRRTLAADPSHLDAFLRLRILFETTGEDEELAALLRRRLEIEPAKAVQVELRRTLAEHHYAIGDRRAAMQHYRTILTVDPADVRAHAAISDIASEHGTWQEAADAVLARVALERDARILKTLHYRLGVIYAEHDVPLALSSFQRALSYRPGDVDSLTRLTDLAIRSTEWQIALDACKELLATEQDSEKQALHLHRAAMILAQGFGDQERTGALLELAIEKAPTNDQGLQLLVQFYKDTGDTAALRAQMVRLAELMRVRIAADVKDGVAYRVIARATTARAEALNDGSQPIARAAAELAQLLGVGGEPEQRVVAGPSTAELSLLVSPRDEVLFPRTLSGELRHVFRLVGDAVAKHVGVDLGAYGVSRKDRLRPTDPIAVIAREVATGIGLHELEVYVSTRQPYAMVAEPTHPVALVLGAAIAAGPAVGIRFAAGAALKLAQMSLSIPARLAPDALGTLTVAILRLVQPELTSPGMNLDDVNALLPRLRKLCSTGLLNEVRPHALAVTGFSHQVLARDLKIAGLRAGLVASGSLLPGLAILAASVNTDLSSIIEDSIVQELISFALSEARIERRADHRP